jgi:hypothetical protein
MNVVAEVGFKPPDTGESEARSMGEEKSKKTGSYDVRRYVVTEHEPLGEPKDVSVDKIKTRGVRGARVVAHLPENKSISEPEVPKDFIRWGIKSYPAKHYVLVFMGHGGAWKGAIEQTPVVMANAIRDGVDEANRATGRRNEIDVTIFNSCLMGNVESEAQMADASKYIIA